MGAAPRRGRLDRARRAADFFAGRLQAADLLARPRALGGAGDGAADRASARRGTRTRPGRVCCCPRGALRVFAATGVVGAAAPVRVPARRQLQRAPRLRIPPGARRGAGGFGPLLGRAWNFISASRPCITSSTSTRPAKTIPCRPGVDGPPVKRHSAGTNTTTNEPPTTAAPAPLHRPGDLAGPTTAGRALARDDSAAIPLRPSISI